MAGPGLLYMNESLYGKEDELILKWKITGAKTSTPLPLNNSAVLTAYDAIASQTTIDSFLGTTNEFLIAQFDATAMGTDAFAGIVNMSGQKTGVTVLNGANSAQAASVLAMTIHLYSGTNGATVVNEGVNVSSTLTSSSLTTQVACGANGNIAFRSILSGLDILTSGLIIARIHWVSI